MINIHFQSALPGGISEAGQRFMDAMPEASAQLTSPDLAPNIRAAAHEEYTPRADRALERYGVSVEKLEIAGVPCLRLLPPNKPDDITQAILYFYGGGYIYGGAYNDICITAALCHFSNTSVIAPQYRLAPEHPWPAASDDAFNVYKALLNDKEISRICFAGESAGGNLTLNLTHRVKQAGLPPPASLALMSPWCDLTPWRTQLANNESPPVDPTLHPDDLDFYTQCYAGENTPTDPSISPIYSDFDPTFPRTMITTATRDVLMPQCIRLAQKMRLSGVDTDLRVYPGLCHVFECYDEIPEAEISIRDFANFLF